MREGDRKNVCKKRLRFIMLEIEVFYMEIVQISKEELYNLIRKAVREELIEILKEAEPTEDEIEAYADALREMKEKKLKSLEELKNELESPDNK